MNLLEAAVAVYILNIAFGYWRANTEKLSRGWFLAIHIPVPIVIAIRFLSGLGWSLVTFPVLIAAFFLGQVSGGRLHEYFGYRIATTSCIFVDVVKICKSIRSGN